MVEKKKKKKRPRLLLIMHTLFGKKKKNKDKHDQNGRIEGCWYEQFCFVMLVGCKNHKYNCWILSDVEVFVWISWSRFRDCKFSYWSKKFIDFSFWIYFLIRRWRICSYIWFTTLNQPTKLLFLFVSLCSNWFYFLIMYEEYFFSFFHTSMFVIYF